MPADHPNDAVLLALARRELDPDTARSVTAHVSSCAVCGDRLSRFTHAAPPDDPPDALPPELAALTHYAGFAPLGAGGMGAVYLARNTLLDRPEVLKVIGRHLLARPGAIDRFRREMRAAAQLAHPNAVAAYSAYQTAGGLVFAMEYVPGETLTALVARRGPLPVAEACEYVRQAADGLQHAHDRGTVHRDIKPGNLMLRTDAGRAVVKVLDFGLAKATGEAADSGLTGTGQPIGTPDFMAPEQTSDAAASDIRADVYALGGTLYFLLTGRPPFPAGGPFDRMLAHRQAPRPRAADARPDVPAGLDAVLARMMAVSPADRYPTPAAAADALRPFTGQLAARTTAPPAAPAVRTNAWESPTAGLRFVRIPSGSFRMGSPPGEEQRQSDELAHPVTLTADFFLAAYPVTRGQFARFAAAAGYRSEAERDGEGGYGLNRQTDRFEGRRPEFTWADPGFDQTDDHPVVNVTWNDAVAFCDWLGRADGRAYRLPTEAEWEYAGRAGTATAWSFGDDRERIVRYGNVVDAATVAWFPSWATYAVASNGGFVFTAPVGQFEPNPWGLYDMHGNVSEWCADWYAEYQPRPQEDPRGPAFGQRRVLRGGGWNAYAEASRSACRSYDHPSFRYYSVGFRVAFDA